MTDLTILHFLYRNGKNYSQEPGYYEKINGSWQATSWGNYLDQVRQATRSLIALGFQKGQVVCILGFNRPEWVILDLAAMLAEGAVAGIYTSNSATEAQYIIDHAESPIVLLEDKGQWEKINRVRDQLPHLRYIVMMRGRHELPDDPMTLSWEQFFLQKGQIVAETEVDLRLQKLKMDELATLIYTSGTTGPPKGVMLSHRNLAWTADMATRLFGLKSTDSSLSYLPLSHIAEQMFTIHAPITMGYPVYFAEGVTKIADNLKEIRPTIVFGVPRVWERFASGVTAKLSEATGVKAKLATWARHVATQVVELQNQGKEFIGLLALQYKIAYKLVLSKIQAALGLDRAHLLVSGAAAIPKSTLEFFATLGLRIFEVYGQSEDTGPTTINRRMGTKFGTVGQAIPGMEVKLLPDGEIIAKGPNVFLGYYKNESSTRETVIDGWLQSGDLGEFDSEGFLTITGRKKEIIITSGGKNIAPKNIEAALTALDLVGSAVVIGEQQRYIVALVTLDATLSQQYAQTHGLPLVDLPNNPAIFAHLKQEIAEKVNPHLARVEQVRHFAILPHDFSVEGGELTPTFKIKRNVVTKKYQDLINRLYSEAQIL